MKISHNTILSMYIIIHTIPIEIKFKISKILVIICECTESILC